MDDSVWMIRVSGYGTFEFIGTDAEAEEMRRHKCNWEQGSGLKWRKNLSRTSDKLTKEIADTFDAGMRVSSKLLKARTMALRAGN
jgi:hypothetical protein